MKRRRTKRTSRHDIFHHRGYWSEAAKIRILIAIMFVIFSLAFLLKD